MAVELHASGASDIGRVRTTNEDAFICDPERGIFAVIDGVGGHAGGEVAASIARRELEMRLRRETGTIEDRLREAIAAANASILAEATRVPALARMACVLTVAVVTPGRVIAAHVGDTRMYKFGPRGMRKLTHDHSPVGLLEDGGHVSEEDAMHHPDRNQVFREVGTSPRQPTDQEFIEVVAEPFGPDEALLLCSDGLTDLVPAAAIEAIVRRHVADPARAVTELLGAANGAGGKDNVTAVVAAGAAFVNGNGNGIAPEVGLSAPASTRSEPAATPEAVSRSWPWAVAAFLGVFAFIALGWWWTGGSNPLETTTQGATPSPRVLRVSASGDFQTITAALAAAQPGDTIEVDPGTYAETLVLREGVVLRSRLRRAATLRRPASAGDLWTAITASGVRSGAVSGFVVAGDEGSPLEYGVVATDAGVEIDDMDVTGARAAAVRIAGASTVRLRSSDIHDNPGAGIVVEAGSTPEILHNVIARNGLATPRRAAIDVRGGARAAISGNIIRQNGAGVSGLSPAEHARLLTANAVEAPRAPQR